MDTYNDILRAIKGHEILFEAIHNMVITENSLDLTRPDWERVLMNNVLYKDFALKCSEKFTDKQNSAYCSVQRVRGGNFNITVVGRFCIVKNQKYSNSSTGVGTSSLISMGVTDPLDQILQVMTGDKNSSVERNRGHRFFFEGCNALVCRYCNVTHADLKKMDILVPPSENQSCITKCKVYDGRQLTNTFRTLIEGGGELLAAVTLCVNCRYTYQHKDGPTTVKIGGVVKNAIFFKDSALKQTEKVVLGDLRGVVATIPAVTDIYQNTDTPTEEIPSLTENTFLESFGLDVPSGNNKVPTISTGVKRAMMEFIEEEEDNTTVIEAIPAAYKNKKQRTNEDLSVTVEHFNIPS